MRKTEIAEKKVVVLEDNPIWSKTLKLWLMHYGFNNIYLFDDVDDYYDFISKNVNDVDVCIIDFYIGEDNTIDCIKNIRKLDSNLLIIAISADFVSDKYVLDTQEMIKAICAGANRVTIKEISHLKEVLFEHLRLRSMDIYDDIKTDIIEIINNNELKE